MIFKETMVRDEGGFYMLPSRIEDLLKLALPALSRIELKLLQVELEVHGVQLSIEHLGFLRESQSSAVLASIELGRRLWAKPVQEKTKIDSPESAAAVLHPILRGKREEHFALLFLNVKNELIGHEVVSIGTDKETLVPVRKIMRLAVQKSCNLIVAHNHPSGGLYPSDEDIEITRQLLNGAKLLGINILDHLVVTDHSFYSIHQTDNWNLPWC
jgi:DNA repair protein RadC